ncbi:MAG: hypothetical protein AB2A00_39150 [Myxococcota bacterium]
MRVDGGGSRPVQTQATTSTSTAKPAQPAQTTTSQPAARTTEPAARAPVDPQRQQDSRTVSRHDMRAQMLQQRLATDVGGPRAEPRFQSAYLDEAHVRRVADMKDPVQRNYAITRGYHELSEGMASLVGKDNANWLTFGKWASNTAGGVIRKEVDVKLPGSDSPVGGLVNFVTKPVQNWKKDDAADAVAKGNQAIFGDIAPHFSRFINTFQNDTSWRKDPARGQQMIDDFVKQPALEGKPDLQNAFRSYHEAMTLKDAKGYEAENRRAELMFQGNFLVAKHEQQVADRFVKGAMPGMSYNDNVTDQMRLNIPGQSLVLGQDVQKAAPFELTSFNAVPEMNAEARRFGQDPQSTQHSDASDWSKYDERMGYIFHYFRSYQQESRLHETPSVPFVTV